MDVITVSKTNGTTTKTDSKQIEDRFTAAVNVIRGLPKNGKYWMKRKNITINRYILFN